MVHLSETGVHAGRRFCGNTDLTQSSSHAMYAPLANESFRSTLCAVCLEVWATEAYEDGDAMPDYIKQIRSQASKQEIAVEGEKHVK
jgi:hypothetical protein